MSLGGEESGAVLADWVTGTRGFVLGSSVIDEVRDVIVVERQAIVSEYDTIGLERNPHANAIRR